MSLTVVTLHSVASAIVGFAFGLLYFAMLRRGVRLFITGESWRRGLSLTLGRLAFALVFLVLVTRLGPLALVIAFAGFLVARVVAVARASRVD